MIKLPVKNGVIINNIDGSIFGGRIMKYANISLVAVLSILIFALIFRMMLGLDFGDEAYYASFIDGWFRNGVGGDKNLMIHQTAALLVYPLAVFYHSIRGNEDGLVLFLRFVYLSIATLSSFCLYRAVSLLRGKVVAALTTSFAILFIPFSLPAPSYNTIGMWSMAAALSLFYIIFSDAKRAGADPGSCFLPGSLWLSAIWWTAACVAYPTMVVLLLVLFALASLAVSTQAERRLVHRYALACCGLLVVAFAILCGTLGSEHLWKALRFTNAAANVSGGLMGKMRMAVAAFATHPRFMAQCGVALLVAISRCLVRPISKMRMFSDAMIGVLIIGVATSAVPTFFLRSHDLILMLALTGSCVALRQLLDRNADSATRIFGAIYWVSLIGGLITAATAYFGLLNFPIGGFVAACLAVTMLTPPPSSIGSAQGRRGVAVGLAVILIACVTMAATSFTYYYGQTGRFHFGKWARMPRGIFAGLYTDPEQASFIAQMTAAIEAQRGCGDRFAVFGNGPGFYLLTTMAPTTLSTWNITENHERNFATEALESFYSAPENQPDVVVVNHLAGVTTLSKSDEALLGNYTFVQRIAVGARGASVYRRAACLL